MSKALWFWVISAQINLWCNVLPLYSATFYPCKIVLVLSFNVLYKWKVLKSLCNPLHVSSYALLSYLLNKYPVTISLSLDLLYVRYQDKFLDMHVLYQQWYLILEDFYLGLKGKFCGLCIYNFFSAVSYYMVVLNYAKLLYLLCRTLKINLIFKHLPILPFKLHPTKQRGGPFYLCIILVFFLHYALSSSSVFLWSSSQGECTHRKEDQQLHHHLCWGWIFFSKLVSHNIVFKYKYNFHLQFDLGATPSLSSDGYLGEKKCFLPKYLCILFVTSKI